MLGDDHEDFFNSIGQNENPARIGLCRLPPAADISLPSSSLLDHLVGAQQERFGDCQAERLGSREIEDELEFGGLFDWDIARFRATENLVNQFGRAPEQVREETCGRAISHTNSTPSQVFGSSSLANNKTRA